MVLGIEKKIPYLKELGINAIYLNPVFYGISSHKYDAVCHHHIDPFLGPDPQKDLRTLQNSAETDDSETWLWTEADKYFLHLVKTLHENGMRIILDGVFNHTGRHFFAFRDILHHGQESSYSGWYKITRWDESLPDGFDYEGWAGTKFLPEFRQEKGTLVQGPEQYVKNVIERWTRPEINPDAGIDGWRLDVASCIPLTFWEKFRSWVRKLNPEAYIVAEIVDCMPSCFMKKSFDALMNYPFGHISREFFLEKKLSAKKTLLELEKLIKLYPQPVSYAMQNLYNSHDTPRLASQIVNRDIPSSTWNDLFFPARVKDNPEYSVHAPRKKDIDIQKMMLLLQFAFVGAPLIYYGEESGMWGANDPDCRKPMIWPEWKYEVETRHPFEKQRPGDPVKFNRELWKFYQKLIAVRNMYSALQEGQFIPLSSETDPVLHFLRNKQGQTIRIVINPGDRVHTVKMETDYSALLKLYPGIQYLPGQIILPPETGEYLLMK